LFSLKGRLGRLRYLVWIWVGNALFTLMMQAVVWLSPPRVVGLVWSITLGIALLAWVMLCSVRRLHDGGHSGIWALGLALPLLAVLGVLLGSKFWGNDAGMGLAGLFLYPAIITPALVFLYCLFSKGDPEENRHGLPPPPNNNGVWIIAILVIFSVASGSLAAPMRLFLFLAAPFF
jgi:uncharacterized membrane protein YhaH (DUF805 family)